MTGSRYYLGGVSRQVTGGEILNEPPTKKRRPPEKSTPHNPSEEYLHKILDVMSDGSLFTTRKFMGMGFGSNVKYALHKLLEREEIYIAIPGHGPSYKIKNAPLPTKFTYEEGDFEAEVLALFQKHRYPYTTRGVLKELGYHQTGSRLRVIDRVRREFFGSHLSDLFGDADSGGQG